jgi:hypothetical protein
MVQAGRRACCRIVSKGVVATTAFVCYHNMVTWRLIKNVATNRMPPPGIAHLDTIAAITYGRVYSPSRVCVGAQLGCQSTQVALACKPRQALRQACVPMDGLSGPGELEFERPRICVLARVDVVVCNASSILDAIPLA